MSDTEDTKSTKPLNFGAAKSEAVAEPNPSEKVEQSTDTVTEPVGDNAQDEGPRGELVDGSRADLVEEVGKVLTEEVSKVEVHPETVLANAPAAVAERVAEAATTERKAKTVEELRAEQDALNQQIAATEKAERSEAVNQIVHVINTYKIPLQEIVDACGGLKRTRKGSPAKAKYRDPATGNTWSGRGKAPLWIKDKNKEEFLITE